MPVETDIGAFLQAAIALIAIANPFAALPVFLSLVPTGDPAGQRQAANRVALAVLRRTASSVNDKQRVRTLHSAHRRNQRDLGAGRAAARFRRLPT